MRPPCSATQQLHIIDLYQKLGHSIIEQNGTPKLLKHSIIQIVHIYKFTNIMLYTTNNES